MCITILINNIDQRLTHNLPIIGLIVKISTRKINQIRLTRTVKTLSIKNSRCIVFKCKISIILKNNFIRILKEVGIMKTHLNGNLEFFQAIDQEINQIIWVAMVVLASIQEVTMICRIQTITKILVKKLKKIILMNKTICDLSVIKMTTNK